MLNDISQLRHIEISYGKPSTGPNRTAAFSLNRVYIFASLNLFLVFCFLFLIRFLFSEYIFFLCRNQGSASEASRFLFNYFLFKYENKN